MNLADMVGRYATLRPERPALVDGARSITWGELTPLVRRTAAHLMALGVRPGDRVGLNLKDHADHVIAMLAVARMGAVILPLDWRAKPAEKARIAAAFEARLILADPGAQAIDGLPSAVIDDAWHAAVAGAPGDLDFRSDGDAELYIAVSSGTTGLPKGAPGTHTTFLQRIGKYVLAIGPVRDHRYLSVTPLCFTAGWSYVLILLSGGSTVILYPTLFSAEEYVEQVARHDATFAMLVPTVLRWLLKLPERDGYLLPSLRTLVATADLFHAEEKRTVQRRICPNLFESYSSSATGPISVLEPREIALRADSVGQPNLLTEVEIVDEEHHPVAPGTVGRVRVRGPGMARRYCGEGADAETARDFRDGWYYIGELGMRDDAGYLYLKGRATSMILRAGVNLYPEEIEPVLEAHPAIDQAAIVGRPHPELGQEVVALVVARGPLTERDILAFCRARLSAHKVPARVFLVDALPRSPAGKLKRAELADQVARLETPGGGP